MKKIIWIIFFIVFGISFLEAAGLYDDPCLSWATQECCCANPTSYFCRWMGYDCNNQWWSTNNTWNNNTWRCDPAKIYRLPDGWTWCCPGVIDDNWNCSAWLSDVGINISTDCLLNWQCSLNVYKVFWIRKQDQNPTVLWFFQDITLASTTAILWTIIIIAIVFSGLLFAFGSITWKDTKRAKTILIDSFVWLLMVMWSYTIIRLIQFLATAWS